MIFLRCVGEAIVAQGMRGLMGLVPMGERVYDVAANAIERYRKEKREQKIAEDAEEVVRAGIDEIRVEARQIAREVAAGYSPEEILQLESYLTQFPGVARQSLKRPADPTGKSIPKGIDLLDPIQLASLLPRRAPRFRIGESVPHALQWQFVELLGAGGFGEVWLACHSFLSDLRAFKFCLDPSSRDRLLRHEGEVVKRVMQASRTANDSEHGIVRLVDACLEGDAPWLAYDYIDGGDLSSMSRELSGRSMPDRAAIVLKLLTNLAAVVGRFHALPQPIVHRDLKPANILLKKVDGKWLLRVTDFGIGAVSADCGIRQEAHSTPSMNLGETYRGAHTPTYASPQQKKGHKADVRDDVYALGVIGYQLLLGDLSAERPAGKWRKRLVLCELSDATLDLLESCWDDDPDERPKDAAALAGMLREEASVEDWSDIDADYASYSDCMMQGNGTIGWLKKHANRAQRWESAAPRHARAMHLLGRCFAEGIAFTQNYAEAMRWYRKAAEAGNGTAMNSIGVLYENGRGVDRDYAEAMRWYRKAAEAGDAAAMNNIGSLYHSARGANRDYAEAMRWFRKAAEAGNAAAMCWIGFLYENGDGVDRDYAEAMRWYRKAAEAGDAAAMNNIGSLYHSARGANRDYAEAMRWFRKAAEAGNAAALRGIGVLYENGHGVAQDYAEAKAWYKKALAAGCEPARKHLASLG